jgi:hypothetical protein
MKRSKRNPWDACNEIVISKSISNAYYVEWIEPRELLVTLRNIIFMYTL